MAFTSEGIRVRGGSEKGRETKEIVWKESGLEKEKGREGGEVEWRVTGGPD